MNHWLLVAGDFTRHGGMDRANFELAASLATDRGAQVTLVTHFAAPELHRPRISVQRVPRPGGSHLLGAPLLARAGKRSAARVTSGAVVVANGGNVDAGDVNWVHYLHAAHRPVAHGLRRRTQSLLSHAWDLSRERDALRHARVIVCNSRRTAADVARHIQTDPSRVQVVYYGVDAGVFSYVDAEARRAARRELGWDVERPVAIFIGALADRRKGFDRLLDAWRILLQGGRWDVDLVVVGHGSELPAWRHRAEAAAPGVRFLGARADVPRLLAASDLLVHPSRYEAYGLGVHEALCRGLPALVSASAGVAERYPRELSDWLIENVEDAEEIAARIRGWHADRDASALRVRAFADTLRARTWQDMTRDFVGAVAA